MEHCSGRKPVGNEAIAEDELASVVNQLAAHGFPLGIK